MEAQLKIEGETEDQFKREMPQSTKSVLIVEDDITAEPIWEYILDRAEKNTHMTWATSVKEADLRLRAAISEGRPYDLLISDIFLSGSLTGIDLWSRFQALMPAAIILMSTIHPIKMQSYFKGQTAPIYLQKPLNMHETIETVYELLQHR